MALLADLAASSYRVRAEAGGRPSPLSDVWYQPAAMPTSSGVPVNPHVAQTLSAVWQATRLIQEGIASLSCHLFERTSENGRRRVRGPRGYGALAYALRWQPHPDLTAFDFWSHAVVCWLHRGLFLAELVPGPRTGYADALVPIHPDLVTVTRRPNGRIYYQIAGPSPRVLGPGDVFAIRGRTEADGVTPMSLIRYAAESLGTAIAADRFAGRFFQQGAAPAIAVTVEDELGEEGIEHLHASVQKFIGGLSHAFGVLPLENGAKVEQIGIKPADAQLLASREFTVEEVARWFNVPLHMLRHGDRGSGSYASLEVFNAEFVTYTLRPVAVAFEQSIQRDLILENDRDDYFAEFNLDAKLRGTLKDRYEAYRIGIMSGFLRRNEARIKENLDPADGLDDFWQPMSIASVDQSAGRSGDDRAAQLFAFAQGMRAGREGFLLIRLVQETAGRLVRREKGEIEKLARQHANDGAGWMDGVRRFYREFSRLLQEQLRLEPVIADEWSARRARMLLDRGVSAVDELDYEAIAELAVLALGTPEKASA